jgi:hypothetical protein
MYNIYNIHNICKPSETHVDPTILNHSMHSKSSYTQILPNWGASSCQGSNAEGRATCQWNCQRNMSWWSRSGCLGGLWLPNVAYALLMYVNVCYVCYVCYIVLRLLRFAWFAMVCICLHYFALFDLVSFGLLWFAMVCYGLLWFAMVCIIMQYYAYVCMVCHGMLWFALVCSYVLLYLLYLL